MIYCTITPEQITVGHTNPTIVLLSFSDRNMTDVHKIHMSCIGLCLIWVAKVSQPIRHSEACSET